MDQNGSRKVRMPLARQFLYPYLLIAGLGPMIAALVSLALVSGSTANAARPTVLLAAALIGGAGALGCYFIFRRIALQLRTIRDGAERFARGDLRSRLPVALSDEVGGLAEALNLMAHQLDERIRAFVTHRNEQDAVLSSMVEGVLALDGDERILNINKAGATLIGTEFEGSRGKSIAEVLRNSQLQKFVKRTLASDAPVEGDISVRHGEREKYLQVHGTALKGPHGETLGALVVLNDVTRLRLLENVRREFVANVSHELRTPITSIKGFVETLLDGAIEQPDDARRFLGIIAKQVDSLNAIVEDLLQLSRLEQETDTSALTVRDGNVRAVLQNAVDVCALGAERKGIRIGIACDPELTALINITLIEQAVVNLIDNAVKYSDNGGEVTVSAFAAQGRLTIQVRDNGWGIESRHLPRLFERFYRVDRARDRKMGGTGLGLAIVKHIVLAHRGTVDVESSPGDGSLFSIHLPYSLRHSQERLEPQAGGP